MSDKTFEIINRRRSIKSSISIIPLALAFIILPACSELNPQVLKTDQDRQITASGDQQALAQDYEKKADEMRAKADEHKHNLELAHTKSYLYGRQRETFENRSRMLISSYEKAVAEYRAMAEAQYRVR